MIEGWKCGECGVVYAPFVTECRCSVKFQGNNDACIHDWAGPGYTCKKCGFINIGGLDFDTPPSTICQHTWSELGQSTGGRHCLNCGALEPWFDPIPTAQGECKL